MIDMRQIVSISRNLSLQVEKRKDKACVTAAAEVIIAYTDGKRYTLNEQGETHRTTDVSETRFHVTCDTVRSLIEYLEGIEKELEEWEKMEEL